MSTLKGLSGVALLVVVALCCAFFWRSHAAVSTEVIDSRVYRSAQPSPDDLQDAKNELGVETVVNLRGTNTGAEWYEAEKRAARDEELRLVSLPFETFDAPPRIETLALVRVLDTTDEPVLLHCRSGNDRSGWAAGVARLLQGETLASARSELSLFGGHFCDLDECALHAFFDDYEGWLERTDRKHDATTFRDWVSRDYYPEPYRARLTMKRFPAATLAPGETLDMTVRIENAARTAWAADSDASRGIRPGARLLGPFDELPEDILARFRIAHAPASDVWRNHWSGEWMPGERRDLDVMFEAPDTAGLWVAQIDMVDEDVHWFSDLGDPGLLVPFRVTAE